MEKALKIHSECIQTAFLFLQLYFSIGIIFYYNIQSVFVSKILESLL